MVFGSVWSGAYLISVLAVVLAVACWCALQFTVRARHAGFFHSEGQDMRLKHAMDHELKEDRIILSARRRWLPICDRLG